MCGIVGVTVFSSSSFKITEEYLVRMRDTMTHRGPDGSGVWITADKKTGLGHRRLSIIDLSAAAAQPMSNEDNSLWISFNGEIYNHAEIRKELESIGGHRWKTDHSDTEVILHAFEQWGIDCVQKFRGMFAIALWDEKQKELWLIRDRIGIKPLYYSIQNGRVTFASEIKALLKDPDQKRALNEKAFYHYLSFLTTPAPDTLFEGIKKLPGGTWLRIKQNGHVQENRYWDVLDHTVTLKDLSEDAIAERLLAELRTAVRYRKVSDVPVGVFLSGGIDSSTNAALFSEGETRPIQTFSIGYKGQNKTYPNELPYARLMADRIKAQQHELLLDVNDLIGFIPKMVYLQDEPIADPVCFPVYYVSKLAKDNGVTVCQVGEGADELFCGYPFWMSLLNLQNYDRYPVPKLFKKALQTCLAGLGQKHSFSYEYLRRGIANEPIFWSGAEAFTEQHKKDLLSPSLQKKFSRFSSWEAIKPIYDRFQKKSQDKSPLNWMSYADLNLRLPELLLMRIDKMSMGVSLEGRVPFLDHKFVELAMSIPPHLKTKNHTLKYILKKAVKDILPEELINRPKQGFGVPLIDWPVATGKNLLQSLDGAIDSDEIFDIKKLPFHLNKASTQQCWTLMNFAVWKKSFLN